jgi:hypothetical protein
MERMLFMDLIIAPLFYKSNSAACCEKSGAAYLWGMSTDKRAKVGPEHRAESAKLKELFNAYKLENKISQASFAADNGIGSQGNLSH